jgi:hypothetical protein
MLVAVNLFIDTPLRTISLSSLTALAGSSSCTKPAMAVVQETTFRAGILQNSLMAATI